MHHDFSNALRHPSIAIVGGGSVGTSFLRQLAERLSSSNDRAVVKRVVLFEPSPNPGAGAAYQADVSSNLLNTRVASMSPIASDPEHFYRWLLNEAELWRPQFPNLQPTADAFVPRSLFGLYLEQVFNEAVQVLRLHGIEFKHIQSRASSIERVGSQYMISTDSGGSLQSTAVVLTIGNLQTSSWAHLQGRNGYFHTPYPCTRLLAEIDPSESVCILGSSLSAIDAAVALADSGHKGKITMLSRHGRLPSVRGEHNLTRQPQLLSRERMKHLLEQRGAGTLTLQEIAQMLLKELELVQGCVPRLEQILRAGKAPHHYLDLEIMDAQTHDRTWQAIVYALNDSIDLIWHLLSNKEKRIFQQHFQSQWLAYRVSFPIENAKKIQALLHTGQITVLGGCSSVRWDEALSSFAVSMTDARQKTAATFFTDKLINATGYGTDVRLCHSPLLRDMLARELLSPNEFGGVLLDFDSGRALSKSGMPQHGLYAMGSLAAGIYFWTNAMNVNTRLAAGVVDHVVEDCLRARHAAPQHIESPSVVA